MKIDDVVTKVEIVDDGEGPSTKKNPLLRSKPLMLRLKNIHRKRNQFQ